MESILLTSVFMELIESIWIHYLLKFLVVEYCNPDFSSVTISPLKSRDTDIVSVTIFGSMVSVVVSVIFSIFLVEVHSRLGYRVLPVVSEKV